MKIEIKNRWTGAVNFTAEIEADENTPLSVRIGLAVKWALKNKISLSGSDLSGSNLRGSNLSGSNLRGSNLSGSNLRGSNLRGSNLSGSNLRGSNLSGSNLRGSNLRGSNLSGSNLRGSNLSGSNLSDSNLSGSNLSGSNLSGSNLSGSNLRGSDLSGSNLRGGYLKDAPFKVDHLDAKILSAIEAGGLLRMDAWHSCGTSHCRGGWAVVMAGEAGKSLEWVYGTSAAAALIYGASRPGQPIPNFSGYQDNDAVLEEIRQAAAKDPIPSKKNK